MPEAISLVERRAAAAESWHDDACKILDQLKADIRAGQVKGLFSVILRPNGASAQKLSYSGDVGYEFLGAVEFEVAWLKDSMIREAVQVDPPEVDPAG